MRGRMGIFVLALCAAGMIGQAARAEDEMVANPQYARWKDFKPGTEVTTKIVAEMVISPAGMSGSKREVTCVQKLESVAEEKVVLDVTYEGTAAVGPMMQPRKVEVPAKIEKTRAEYPMAASKDVKITGVHNGAGRLEVDGKTTDVKTKELDVESTSNGQTARTHIRMWLLESVPGGVVKSIADTAIVMGERTVHNTRTTTLVNTEK